MSTDANRLMGGKWRERLQHKAIQDAKRNDPEILERRKQVQARQEAERAEQSRINAEAEARRAAETVSFGPLTIKMATEIVVAYERYRSAGREATPAEMEAVSRMSQGLPAHPGSPVIRLAYSLPMPVPASGVPSQAVEPMAHQPDPSALDNVLQKPAKAKRDKPAQLASGLYLIDDED